MKTKTGTILVAVLLAALLYTGNYFLAAFVVMALFVYGFN